MTSEIVLLDGAESALVLASTVPEINQVRDVATGARAFAKSRGLGVEAENKAAELILRAERKIGQVLIDMAESGERAGPGGGAVANQYGRQGSASAPTLEDLGISYAQSRDWRRLAALPDDLFERMIAAAKAGRERIAKNNFYAEPKGSAPEAEVVHKETQDEPGWIQFRDGAVLMLKENSLARMPHDQKMHFASLIQDLVDEYKRVRRG